MVSGMIPYFQGWEQLHVIEAEMDASALLMLGDPGVAGRKTWADVDLSTLGCFGEVGTEWADAMEEWVGWL